MGPAKLKTSALSCLVELGLEFRRQQHHQVLRARACPILAWLGQVMELVRDALCHKVYSAKPSITHHASPETVRGAHHTADDRSPLPRKRAGRIFQRVQLANLSPYPATLFHLVRFGNLDAVPPEVNRPHNLFRRIGQLREKTRNRPTAKAVGLFARNFLLSTSTTRTCAGVADRTIRAAPIRRAPVWWARGRAREESGCCCT